MKIHVLLAIMGITLLLAGCTSQSGGSLFGAAQLPGLCKDSDMGINFELKGTTSAGASQKVDSCNGNQITEYYCMLGQLKSTTGSCGQNYECKDGECVPKIQETCVVSEYGVIQHTNNEGDTNNWVNGCSKEGKLVQYSCSENKGLVTEILECPAGQTCVSDACVALE